MCFGFVIGGVIFSFKRKTAYELRISDWSSDVCSSDLTAVGVAAAAVCTSSTAVGEYSLATGEESTAVGGSTFFGLISTEASGSGSAAFGNGAWATGG